MSNPAHLDNVRLHQVSNSATTGNPDLLYLAERDEKGLWSHPFHPIVDYPIRARHSSSNALEEDDESSSDGSVSIGIRKLAFAIPLNTVFSLNTGCSLLRCSALQTLFFRMISEE